MSRVEKRIDDYLAMGVAYVWVLDPQTRKAYSATAADRPVRSQDRGPQNRKPRP